MLVKLKVTVQMRSITIAIKDGFGKYLLGTVGFHGTCRGPQGAICVVVPAKTLQLLEHLISLAYLESEVHPQGRNKP